MATGNMSNERYQALTKLETYWKEQVFKKYKGQYISHMSLEEANLVICSVLDSKDDVIENQVFWVYEDGTITHCTVKSKLDMTLDWYI